MGEESIQYRVNDDGEPTNAAGQPIYGQILSKELTNILVVVVRYFGGVKLGVGGLINAYKNATKLVLDSCDISEKFILSQFEIEFEYSNLNKVMRLIKENNVIVMAQKMDLKCQFQLAIRKKDKEILENLLHSLYEVTIVNHS